MNQIVSTTHVSSDEDNKYIPDHETEKRFKDQHYIYFLDKIAHNALEVEPNPIFWKDKSNTKLLLYNITNTLIDSFIQNDSKEAGEALIDLLKLCKVYNFNIGTSMVTALNRELDNGQRNTETSL